MIRNPKNTKSGSVLVVGGGIAGIQSSLDLAESGFKVYLLEDSPAIGGTMAQLDKTFPTNDCAMCIVSPKLVSCASDMNIEMLMDSQLKEVSGEAGNFKVKVHKRPRFVDLEKCTGCGECEEVCPIDIGSKFDEGLVDRKAIYKPYAQASPNAFAIDKRSTAPCQTSCPSDIHVQGYIALAREKKYKEAYDLIRERNPFPSVCGRVCFHPCEEECRRGEYDDPLAIASIKRYIADWVMDHKDEYEDTQPKVEQKEEKVAVIGGGPAGLTCAYYLSGQGYQVTVFDRDERAGGMMRAAIPDYRLPQENLDWEIDQILKSGIDFRGNTEISTYEDYLALKEEGFKAFYLAIGTQKGIPLGIKGEELDGVQVGIDYLRKVNFQMDAGLGKKVAVIGGGNTAIDCARTAVRLGSDVTLLYRRTRREMPAEAHEIVAAEEEGVKLRFLTNPIECVDTGGHLSAVKFQEMRLSEPDESGRRRPVPTGETFTEEFDSMLVAVSQKPALTLLEGNEIELTRWDTVSVDPVTYATSKEGVFAGGDIVLGPASVVEAVGQAFQAAVSIDRYLKGEDLAEGRSGSEELLPARENDRFVMVADRVRMPEVKPGERIGSFIECEKGFSEEELQSETSRCLECGICSGCNQCEVVCEAGAIVHDMVGETVEIDVGAIIVATGAEKFDPSVMHEYGYGRYDNVLTSIQFERVLAASGPFEGHLQRPSDGKIPKKIAWLQCVGSRTEDSYMPYCSSVCCMYAMKEAIIAKEHEDIVEPTIFFMDMRAHGKDFDKYYDRAKETGVRFVRGRVGKIRELPESGNLMMQYTSEDGEVSFEEFDMVVLSVGFTPRNDMKELSDALGVRLNPYQFIEHVGNSQIDTTRPGIFVCGPAVAPKDIPETVMQASGSVAMAAEILSDARGTEIVKKEYPPEKDVAGQSPRIGVFVCHCGINIGSVVDIPAVVEFAKSLPGVVYSDENLFTCSQDTQQLMKEVIDEHKLNRVVVSSCSPSTHEPLFHETLRESGLNPYLFDMANIRNQCSWVHRDDPVKATEKAKILTRIAIGKARLLEPLHTLSLDVTQTALVIGGGLAGMVVALSIAEQGFEVALVEREKRLGGNLNRLRRRPDGEKVDRCLEDLKQKIADNPRVRLFLDSEVMTIDGYIGNYVTSIRSNWSGEVEDYEHGVIVITTGAKQTEPTEYLFEDERVVSQLDLEDIFEEDEKALRKMKNVVMIQCVGSRNEEHPYCSRVCCTQAVKNAIHLKELNPKMNVYILYRDVRTYGFNEIYYQQARAAGVTFIRYEEDAKPVVEYVGEGDDRKLSVRLYDRVLGSEVEIRPDRIFLSPAMEPQEDASKLSQMLKIPLNEDNFFMEAHVKLRPVDFSAEGIFLAGLAHSPKQMDETVSQAKAAAERACTIISSDEYVSVANTAEVDADTCAACGICVAACPYDAPGLVWLGGRQVCQVNTALCKGCGSCGAVCPSGAMQQLGFKEIQTLEMVNQSLGLI